MWTWLQNMYRYISVTSTFNFWRTFSLYDARAMFTAGHVKLWPLSAKEVAIASIWFFQMTSGYLGGRQSSWKFSVASSQLLGPEWAAMDTKILTPNLLISHFPSMYCITDANLWTFTLWGNNSRGSCKNLQSRTVFQTLMHEVFPGLWPYSSSTPNGIEAVRDIRVFS